MKIYKVYNELSETRENSTAAFEAELDLQDGNEGFFTTSETEAYRHYNSIAVMPMAARMSYATVTYRYEGKLIEVGEISDEEFNEIMADDGDLRYAFCSCDSFDGLEMEVSSPWTDETYYMADDEHIDEIYWNQQPYCMTEEEIEYLAGPGNWDVPFDELMEQFHVASVYEIHQYGVSEWRD